MSLNACLQRRQGNRIVQAITLSRTGPAHLPRARPAVQAARQLVQRGLPRLGLHHRKAATRSGQRRTIASVDRCATHPSCVRRYSPTSTTCRCVRRPCPRSCAQPWPNPGVDRPQQPPASAPRMVRPARRRQVGRQGRRGVVDVSIDTHRVLVFAFRPNTFQIAFWIRGFSR